jgi:hypothetical protein
MLFFSFVLHRVHFFIVKIIQKVVMQQSTCGYYPNIYRKVELHRTPKNSKATHKNAKRRFNVNTQARLDKVERITPESLLYISQLCSRKWNQQVLATSVSGITRNPVPEKQALRVELLSNRWSPERKRIMSRAAYNRWESYKSIFCIYNGLEGYTIKALPTVVVSREHNSLAA